MLWLDVRPVRCYAYPCGAQRTAPALLEQEPNPAGWGPRPRGAVAELVSRLMDSTLEAGASFSGDET